MRHENGTVHIGATTTLTQVRRPPGSRCSPRPRSNVGGWAVQNMGTAGGNLFAPPPAGDLAVALLALDARVKIASQRRGERMVPLAEFYTGFMTNCLEPDELVVEIQVPEARRARPSCSSTAGCSPTRRPIVTVAVHVVDRRTARRGTCASH